MPDTSRPMGPLTPEWAISALGRAGFGARPEEFGQVLSRGFAAWVDEQLAPREDQDNAVHERLARLMLRVKYPVNPKWPAVDELRPITYLDKPIEAAWPLIEKFPNLFFETSSYLVDGGIEEFCRRYTASRLIFGSGFPDPTNMGMLSAVIIAAMRAETSVRCPNWSRSLAIRPPSTAIAASEPASMIDCGTV